jgi:SAM-dependent methyltransferase
MTFTMLLSRVFGREHIITGRYPAGIVTPSHPRRATSFHRAADVYDRARPGYPRPAVEWAVGPKHQTVLDLAAGTGKLSVELVGLGHDVVALEPLEQMIRRLTTALPSVSAVMGVAERLPFAGSSLDAAVIAQALHWLDPERTFAELGRVLRPGGALAMVWNVRDEGVPWVAELTATIGSEKVSSDWRENLEASPLFGPIERRDFRHEQSLDLTTLLDLVASRSYVITLTDTKRAEVFAAVRRLWSEHPDLASRERAPLPYVTEVYRVHRNGP